MGIVIGIDVGISTTKIVGIKNNKVSAPIRITAADPITSLYGATTFLLLLPMGKHCTTQSQMQLNML